MTEPSSVTVIVYCAKNLKGKKKGRHKYSVVFGVGDKKFCTDVNIEASGCPTWNEESVIPLENGQYPLVLTVKEKDDPLGQVVVPLINLPVKEFSKKVTVPLKPHKKCPHPEGELTYEAWISKKTPSIVCSTELETHPSPLFKLKHHLRKSPLLHRKNHASKLSSDDLQVNNSLTDSKVAFRSMQDLSNSTFHVQLDEKDKVSPAVNILASSTLTSTFLAPQPIKGHRRYGSHMDVEQDSLRPQIYSITPNEGPCSGSTKVTITGDNLGTHLEDVIGLNICGANCLRSIEYVSSKCLRCTTKAYKPCKGFVSVETQTGGKGTSLVQFTFAEERQPPDGEQKTFISHKSELTSSWMSKTPDIPKRGGLFSKPANVEMENKGLEKELMAEIKKLKAENKDLKDQNETMKQYIDNLVARVMEECPEALASPRRPRATTQ